MTTPVPVAAPVDVEQEIKNILGGGVTDVEAATSKIMALLDKGETSAPVSAFKSFVGNVLKSGRGGAALGMLGSMGASLFLGQSWMLYAAAAIVGLAVTAPTATSFYTSNTKGEPMWALGLMAVLAAVVGGAALWAVDHVTMAMVTGFVSKL